MKTTLIVAVIAAAALSTTAALAENHAYEQRAKVKALFAENAAVSQTAGQVSDGQVSSSRDSELQRLFGDVTTTSHGDKDRINGVRVFGTNRLSGR